VAPRPLPHLRRSVLPLLLRCLPGVENSIINFQPFEQRCLGGIEPEGFYLFDKPIAPFRVVVRIKGLSFVAPTFDFVLRFPFAVSVKPFS
jgi:hypothetical protein